MIIILKLVWLICTWVFFGVLLLAFNYAVICAFVWLFDLFIDYPCMILIYLMKKIPFIGEWMGNGFATIVTGGLLIFTLVCVHIPFVFIMLKALKGWEDSDVCFMYHP